MESYLELGERLKEIRGNMGLSLEQVSALTGVSKTMLSQIESSKSIPTIATVFKIANGLKIKVDSLLSGKRKQYYEIITINNLSPVIDNHERVYMYCIFPFSPTTGFEVYYCIYKSGCDHESVTHQNANMEYLTVFQGELELVVENRSYIVKSGEAIEFDATLPHKYINKGETDVIAQALLSY